jgi:hypothetical protein
MPDEPQLDYTSPGTRMPGRGRSPATWAKLLAVWAVGLVSWTFYVLAILYLWIKWI